LRQLNTLALGGTVATHSKKWSQASAGKRVGISLTKPDKPASCPSLPNVVLQQTCSHALALDAPRVELVACGLGHISGHTDKGAELGDLDLADLLTGEGGAASSLVSAPSTSPGRIFSLRPPEICTVTMGAASGLIL